MQTFSQLCGQRERCLRRSRAATPEINAPNIPLHALQQALQIVGSKSFAFRQHRLREIVLGYVCFRTPPRWRPRPQSVALNEKRATFFARRGGPDRSPTVRFTHSRSSSINRIGEATISFKCNHDLIECDFDHRPEEHTRRTALTGK